jgi:signal recognition particle subunit SEC65
MHPPHYGNLVYALEDGVPRVRKITRIVRKAGLSTEEIDRNFWASPKEHWESAIKMACEEELEYELFREIWRASYRILSRSRAKCLRRNIAGYLRERY